MFLKFQAMVQTQFNATIQFLQYDWGGEYKSLSKLLESQGIFHRISCPYTPQQWQGRKKKITMWLKWDCLFQLMLICLLITGPLLSKLLLTSSIGCQLQFQLINLHTIFYITHHHLTHISKFLAALVFLFYDLLMITSCNFGPVNVSSLVIIHNIKDIYVLITHRVELIFLGMLCSMNSFSLSNIRSLSPYTSCPSSLITIPIFSSSITHIFPFISNFTPTPLSYFSSLLFFSSISLFIPPFDPPTTATSLPPPSQPSTSSNPLVKDLHISPEKTRPSTHNDHPW